MEKRELKGFVIFYAHARPVSTAHCLAVWVHSLFSPRFAHCAVATNGFIFDYGKRGYKVSTSKRDAAEEVETMLDAEALLAWDRPRPVRFGRLKLTLSLVFPFKNCATEAARAAGVRAKTPDALYRELTGERE